MPTPSERPTALTEEEQRDIAFLESVESGWAKRVLAIIRRLDARVGELETNDAMEVLSRWDNIDKATAIAERDALAAQVARLREALTFADNTVSVLHDFVWNQGGRPDFPRDRANDLVWTLHETLRAALRDAEAGR